MRPLTAAHLLDTWEGAAGRSPVERALALLAVACPDEPTERLASLPIGERDALLLDLRETIFGVELTSVANCPACGERLEFNFETSDIRQLSSPHPGGAGLELESDGARVSFRLPNSSDLLAARRGGGDARQALVERCVLQAVGPAGELAPGQLAPALLDALAQAMAAADPLADIRLATSCHACGHAWNVPFDVAAYLWTEIETWAYRTLQEVHRLALAYGWSQADILQMSAWRRQYYLALL